MTDIPPIDGTGKVNAPLPSGPTPPARRAETPPSEIPPDRVEISEVAQVLSTLEPTTAIRAEKVAEVREAIAKGTYLTDEKIAVTVDRLLEALRASAVK
jgi:anti-sigma28 factor (negative regulator of flagellin synthesis)